MARKTAKNPLPIILPIVLAIAGAGAGAAVIIARKKKRKAIAAPPVAYPPDMIPEYAPPPERKPSAAEKWQETAQKIMTGKTAQQIAQTPGATAATKSMLDQIWGTKPSSAAQEKARITEAEARARAAEAKAREAEAKAQAASAHAKALDTARVRETDPVRKAALEKQYDKATDVAAKEENKADEAGAEKEIAEGEVAPKPKAGAKEAVGAATTAKGLLGVSFGTMAIVAGIGLALYGIYDGVQKLQKKFRKYKKLKKAYNAQAIEYGKATKEISGKIRTFEKEIGKTKRGIANLRAYALATS